VTGCGFGAASTAAAPIETLPLNEAPSWMTRRATRTSPFNEPDFATVNRFRAVTWPLTWPRMFTSLPASDAVTLA